MFEDGHDATVKHALGEGRGVFGGDGGVVAKRPVAHDLQASTVNVDHGGEINGDAMAGQRGGHVVGHATNLFGFFLLGHGAGRREGAQHLWVAEHPPAFKIDTNGEWSADPVAELSNVTPGRGENGGLGVGTNENAASALLQRGQGIIEITDAHHHELRDLGAQLGVGGCG